MGFLYFFLVSVLSIINSCEKTDNLIIELAIPDVPTLPYCDWTNQSRSCRDQTMMQRKRNKETCECIKEAAVILVAYSQSHVYLVLIVWISRSKMTAGSSQRNAAVVLLIFHLYLYGSYQLTELQVSGLLRLYAIQECCAARHNRLFTLYLLLVGNTQNNMFLHCNCCYAQEYSCYIVYTLGCVTLYCYIVTTMLHSLLLLTRLHLDILH